MKSILRPAIFLCCIFVLGAVAFERFNLKKSFKLIPSRLIRNDASIDANTYIPTLPTLATIFKQDNSLIATLSADHIRTILVTGDIIPARSVNLNVINHNNPLWPYEKVITPIKDLHPDIIFANLETPLLHDCSTTAIGMVFCGSDRNVEGLKAINVTVASLANNHAGNHDVTGVAETIETLKKNNIEVTGINGPFIKDIRGVKFAFLGYNDISAPQPGIANADESLIANEINEAKKQADVVIVMYHWGVEYRAQPGERQKYLAHFTIDHGADLVLSNHPHWIQPVEIYKNKYIMYAHGNFIFDQMWSEETKKGVLGLYTFYDNQLIDAKYFPLYIENFGQAKFMDGIEKEKVLSELQKQSLLLEKDTHN